MTGQTGRMDGMDKLRAELGCWDALTPEITFEHCKLSSPAFVRQALPSTPGNSNQHSISQERYMKMFFKMCSWHTNDQIKYFKSQEIHITTRYAANWKCNFPMSPHRSLSFGGWLVSLSVGRSVCHKKAYILFISWLGPWFFACKLPRI